MKPLWRNWSTKRSWPSASHNLVVSPCQIPKLVEASNEGYPTPPADATDLEGIIKTVIEAERGAIEVYNK